MRGAAAFLLLLALAGSGPAPAAPPASPAAPAPAAGAAPAGPAPPQAGDEPLVRGQLIQTVHAAGQPGETYALYLPAAYSADRAWPIVYLLDPRGRGDRAARLFQAGAERFGYCLASSYNSLSDGPLAPTVAAMQAMWNDTHRRLRLDDRRLYAAGFSGTVRAAVLLGLRAPGTFAAIIGAAAGWPEGQPPTRDTALPFFGTVGNHDFNYDEMMLLEERLDALGSPHHFEVFDGTHQWMPAELATAALAWVTLGALRAGSHPADPALVAALFAPRLAAARALDGGHLDQAARAWRQLADDFQGLLPAADMDPVAHRAAELAAMPAVVAAARRRAERVRGEQLATAAALHTLAAALDDAPSEATSLPRLLADLHLGELQARARSKTDPDDSLAAQRQLNSLLVQTSFYLPRQYAAHQQDDRALLALAVAAEIDPHDADTWYQSAAANARLGRRRQALKMLERAADAGFGDADRLANDADFAPLRGDADFARQLARVRAAAAAHGPA